MKPRVYFDRESDCMRIEQSLDNRISLTEIHSFIKDLLSELYDFHKFSDQKLGDYIE